jgi:hypothetical protein
VVTGPAVAPTNRPSRHRGPAKEGATTGPRGPCFHCNKPGHTAPNCKVKQTAASFALAEKRKADYITSRDARRDTRAVENDLLARVESEPTFQYDTDTDGEQDDEEHFPCVISALTTPLASSSVPLHLCP